MQLLWAYFDSYRPTLIDISKNRQPMTMTIELLLAILSSVPNIWVKGHLVQRLLPEHTDMTHLPGPLKWCAKLCEIIVDVIVTPQSTAKQVAMVWPCVMKRRQ